LTLQITRLKIPEILLLEPLVLEDERGFFYESYNKKIFDEFVGYLVSFVQDNHSRSVKGTLRGLHYQLPPRPQGKLVRVTMGEVFDVAVDIRKGSSTFGHWVGEYLSADNKHQLWIPPGFAHGFLVTSDVVEFQYKCTDFYAPECEAGIRWNDKELDIEWPLAGQPLVSTKDEQAATFQNSEYFD
jgi:dTDP-4-dehydrorhamnose 3,5-epimerase